MSHVHLKNHTIPWNQPEDREGLFRTRRPGRGHLGHSGGWQDTEGNNTPYSIHIPNQQKPQKRGLEGYVSSSSAHQLLKDLFQRIIDIKRFNLASHWEELGACFQKVLIK
ncbi:hypothetical protein O181_065644 [Austropuccinia psidii MF-1]|uniref:Uncharacterized protein n=1 Tax=Austropuccinia psidii MF-1 TaxID=1389203 RepID=A0A9Q3ERF7_9BASI|nr:hypothetical protein [Austropuccinia psidii MF-1]